VAIKESVPLGPPLAAATNCEVTPFGRLPAVTDTELAMLALLTVTPIFAGVPS